MATKGSFECGTHCLAPSSLVCLTIQVPYTLAASLQRMLMRSYLLQRTELSGMQFSWLVGLPGSLASVEIPLHRLWNVEERNCIITLCGHEGRVLSCAVSSLDPQSQIIVSGGYDTTVKLWRRSGGHPSWFTSFLSHKVRCPSKGECINTLAMHKKRVRTVSFSPCGTAIASGGDDAAVHLWRLQEDRTEPLYV